MLGSHHDTALAGENVAQKLKWLRVLRNFCAIVQINLHTFYDTCELSWGWIVKKKSLKREREIDHCRKYHNKP